MLRRLLALLLSLSAYIALPANAGTPLRLALLHTEPWGYYATDGLARERTPLVGAGIMVEVAQAIAQESGIEFRHKLIPHTRMWRDIKTGDCDLAFAIRSADRDDYVRYAGHLFTLDTIVVGRPGLKLNSYNDLSGLRIGVLGDIRLNPKFDEDGQLHKIALRDYETMVEMLLAGRLDAVAGNSISLHYLLQKAETARTAMAAAVTSKNRSLGSIFATFTAHFRCRETYRSHRQASPEGFLRNVAGPLRKRFRALLIRQKDPIGCR